MVLDFFITIFQLPFIIIAGFLSMYILLVTMTPLVVSLKAKKRHSPHSRMKFAIIIPAHNEEKVIEKTLTSAKNIDYPGDLYDVIVVADNCIDRTAHVALSSGAIVIERSDPSKRGKGYALNWIIPQVINRLPRYDACVFVDADSIISQNFLEEMNASLHEGHQIIQSSDLVMENQSSWRVQLVLIGFALQNYVRPLGKSLLGFSVALKGNGMCFSSEVLQKIHWDENSLGEDLDMGLELIRNGARIHFNPRAVVYALMPTQASSATTQRVRWEGGRFQSMKSKFPVMLKEAVRKKSVYILEAAIDAAFPPLALWLMGTLFFIMLNGASLALEWVTSPVLLLAWILVLTSIFLHCTLGMVLARIHPRNLLALIHMPKFLLWKTGVYMRMLMKKREKEWVRTAR